MLDPQDIINQLLDERHGLARITLLLDRFCRLLREAGVPIDRCNMSLRGLHPQFIARSYHWTVEAGGAAEVGRGHEVLNDESYLNSPFYIIFEKRQSLRRRLESSSANLDYPVLAELKEQGFTDYMAMPLRFSGHRVNALTLATRALGGFTDEHKELIKRIRPVLATLVELSQQRETARTLLSTYVGARTGARVWQGTVKRGQGETIFAVVFLCDLRGFTERAARLPLPDVIMLLNDYFDAVGTPIARHGGEIMKFMGDAILAIFPCERDISKACQASNEALRAARDGLAALGVLNEQRLARGEDALVASAALTVGDVLYGNIGVGDRLDFTVIGPAVNLAARLQALTPLLQQNIVVSEEVARRLPCPTISLGQHLLKGVPGLCEAFAPSLSAEPQAEAVSVVAVDKES